jgi:asparagine synthase (glutamine-hydrolysing)
LPYLENSITDKDFLAGFKKAKYERVLIRNKEHLFYYRIYRKFFDAPFHQIGDQLIKCKRCPFCNTLFIWKGSFCKTCGAYPV